MKSEWRLVVGFSRYDAQRAGRSVVSRDVRRVARLARPLEMPCLWQTGDQPLAPLPHTHGPKVPVPLLPGHVQQDRHPPLPHTHQAQGDSVRQRVLRQRVVREGAAVEDADCPAKEAAAATSASSSLRRQAFDRPFLRIRTPLTGRAPTDPCLRRGERLERSTMILSFIPLSIALSLSSPFVAIFLFCSWKFFNFVSSSLFIGTLASNEISNLSNFSRSLTMDRCNGLSSTNFELSWHVLLDYLFVESFQDLVKNIQLSNNTKIVLSCFHLLSLQWDEDIWWMKFILRII